MRECRTALVAMLGMVLAFATAVTTQLQWIMPQSGLRGVMLEEGCEMVGNLLLVTLTVPVRAACHSRCRGRVAREAGRQEAGKKGRAQEGRVETGGRCKRGIEFEPPARSVAGRQATHRSQPGCDAKNDDDDYYEEEVDERDQRSRRAKHRVDDAEDLTEDRKLSKADRKAMRRHKEQQRRGDLS